MNKNTNTAARIARRKKYRRRRIALLTLIFLLIVCVLIALFWGIDTLIHQSYDDTSLPVVSTTTSEKTTTVTTTRPTVPLLDASSLNAQITSKRVIVYNVTYDREVYSKNADEQCAPASTTKLLTATVMLKFTTEDTVFHVGDELSLVEYGSSVSGLKAGQTLTRSQLLDALLIPSGNDAAYVLAANVGRMISDEDPQSSTEAVAIFMTEMNRVAEEIGCKNSHFINPDGMTADGHYTTARDMLAIARYANTFEDIRESVRKPSVSTTISGQDYYWENSNRLVHSTSPFVYTTGMKTGYTSAAGHCLVTSANRIGEEVIVVVLGGETSDERYNDTQRLLEAAYEHTQTVPQTQTATNP